jgi:hypothetical protein
MMRQPPSPSLPTRGRVPDRVWGTMSAHPPAHTSPLVGEAGRGEPKALQAEGAH